MRARRTLYKGIQMRSRLEATCARLLDRLDIEWQYEPRCFADDTGQYLPDFELKEMPNPEYWEVKPHSVTRDMADLFSVFDKMEIIYSSYPDTQVELAVITPAYLAGEPSWIWQKPCRASMWQGPFLPGSPASASVDLLLELALRVDSHTVRILNGPVRPLRHMLEKIDPAKEEPSRYVEVATTILRLHTADFALARSGYRP